MKRKLMLLMTCLMIGIGLVNAQVRKVTGRRFTCSGSICIG